jgi:hypothetical protein
VLNLPPLATPDAHTVPRTHTPLSLLLSTRAQTHQRGCCAPSRSGARVAPPPASMAFWKPGAPKPEAPLSLEARVPVTLLRAACAKAGVGCTPGDDVQQGFAAC